MAMFPWIGQSTFRFIEVQQDLEDDEGLALQSTLAKFFTLSLAGALTLQTKHFSHRHAMTNAQSHGSRYFQQVYRYTRQGRVKSVS